MTAHPNPPRAAQDQDPHRALHSADRALAGEHPGRSRSPLVKVAGLAWLEFEKPDLEAAERFLADFGFTVADRMPDTLILRGRQATVPCLAIRRGPRARFTGPTFQAAAREDLDRLARGTGGTVTAHWGGHAVALRDPSGIPVRVVHGVPELPALPGRAPLSLNFGPAPVRVNAPQRPVRRAAQIERLGHVVLGTTRFHVAALVVANDVSARQIQLTKTQFYEAKSYPTFTPAGPWLTLVDAADLARLSSLRLTLSVNGQVRQDALAADMIVRPARALTLLSRFQPLAPGDLLLTGTPGGTALKAPAKAMEKLAGLLPPAARWRLFFRRQADNPRYLHDGDVITATIAIPDGQLNLGTQRTTVIGKTP